MALDLTNLQKAIDSLDRTLTAASADKLAAYDKDTQEAIKAGVVQNFEFTYELCWKFLQRWIRINISPDEENPRTKKDLFRLAAKSTLIQNPEAWFNYAEIRNITSHTYDEINTVKVLETATPFLADAKALLKQLELHND